MDKIQDSDPKVPQRGPDGFPLEPPKRKGRPPKKKKGVGRPKGEGTIMKEYRERMLNSPKSRKVLDAILNAALDNEHKNQAAAWKLVVDRIMPVGACEKVAGADKGRNAIQINITGVPGVEISPTEDPLEGDYEEMD